MGAKLQQALFDAAGVETVTAFTRRVKQLLETGIGTCGIRGEISNLRRQSSGHCYFSLKDQNSQVSAVLFRGDAARCRIDLRDGMQVVVVGEISVYEPRGTYQVIVRNITEDGLGRLQQEFERLKRKLEEEGLFDDKRKQALPTAPLTVGFITSPSGAALQDFIRILKRRNWKGRLIVLPARVQGSEAADEIIAMLRLAGRLDIFDLLVVGRGGGSLEDLWAFNEEHLVRAVAACPLPLVSAVGHQTDFTLTDFAADKRAETPSAAAELISSSFIRCDERFTLASRTLDAMVLRHLSDHARHIETLRGALRLLSPRNLVERNHLRLDDLGNRMSAAAGGNLAESKRRAADLKSRLERFSPSARIDLTRQRLDSLADRLNRSLQQVLRARRERMEGDSRQLKALSPDSILQRGFVIVRDIDGNVVTRRAGLKPGRQLINQFADGKVAVKVSDDADRS